jgi:guanine deaminase
VDEDVGWVERAVEMATANVGLGGGPFGALVVREGEVVGRGTNRVTAEHDPTAHAEVVAIRDACRQVDDFSLAGCMLYASCEPCPLCLAAALWSRVDGVVWAADRHAAARAGFDDAAFHALLGSAPADDAAWPLRLGQVEVDTAEAPFDAWRAFDGRVAY